MLAMLHEPHLTSSYYKFILDLILVYSLLTLNQLTEGDTITLFEGKAFSFIPLFLNKFH